MTLDRKTVDETAAAHIRQLRERGAPVTEEDKRRIRREHERIAQKVQQRRR